MALNVENLRRILRAFATAGVLTSPEKAFLQVNDGGRIIYYASSKAEALMKLLCDELGGFTGFQSVDGFDNTTDRSDWVQLQESAFAARMLRDMFALAQELVAPLDEEKPFKK